MQVFSAAKVEAFFEKPPLMHWRVSTRISQSSLVYRCELIRRVQGQELVAS